MGIEETIQIEYVKVGECQEFGNSKEGLYELLSSSSGGGSGCVNSCGNSTSVASLIAWTRERDSSAPILKIYDLPNTEAQVHIHTSSDGTIIIGGSVKDYGMGEGEGLYLNGYQAALVDLKAKTLSLREITRILNGTNNE